ncbi:2-oxoacid:acceptor oxidoreductase family protein [Vulcanisaeta sp. JCM 14467]|uniref:2-oxoacid:acceptor oxidoreductase family protein n=1 Tax=Vulcanisaeta sp. JCM 14467 TaxID=1295370 RepID=UPI000AE8E705|nr:2-oxoacid:acceptor oxidoreductase family protein [Vulcanisaeta sp. JCM 14467]
MNELRYIIGGPQGGGLETTSEILSWAFARSGYGIISDREYFSNIKGRHSYVHATVSATELLSTSIIQLTLWLRWTRRLCSRTSMILGWWLPNL